MKCLECKTNFKPVAKIRAQCPSCGSMKSDAIVARHVPTAGEECLIPAGVMFLGSEYDNDFKLNHDEIVHVVRADEQYVYVEGGPKKIFGDSVWMIPAAAWKREWEYSTAFSK